MSIFLNMFIICQKETVSPTTYSDNQELHQFSEMLESLRKDVECVFGILKQKFAILKTGFRVSSTEVMNNVFLTCCSIYMWRKNFEGRNKPWNLQLARCKNGDVQNHDDEEESSDSEIDADDETTENTISKKKENEKKKFAMKFGIPTGFSSINSVYALDVTFSQRKALMIKHFDTALKLDLVYWAREHGVSYLYDPPILKDSNIAV